MKRITMLIVLFVLFAAPGFAQTNQPSPAERDVVEFSYAVRYLTIGGMIATNEPMRTSRNIGLIGGIEVGSFFITRKIYKAGHPKWAAVINFAVSGFATYRWMRPLQPVTHIYVGQPIIGVPR